MIEDILIILLVILYICIIGKKYKDDRKVFPTKLNVLTKICWILYLPIFIILLLSIIYLLCGASFNNLFIVLFYNLSGLIIYIGYRKGIDEFSKTHNERKSILKILLGIITGLLIIGTFTLYLISKIED